MDPSKMTDEELRAFVDGPAPTQVKKDPSQMTDEELKAFVDGPSPVPVTGDDYPVVNETHDAIGVMDRFLAKNFTADNSEESMAAYLKKVHPDLDIKTGADGKVLIRRPDEKVYKVLDPQHGLATLGHPLELLSDLGDSAYDLGSGVVTSAATAAAGLGGGAASGGTLALPAAAGAGMATSGALEGVRQGLGNMLGVADGVSGSELAMAAGTGALSPLLFGTGAAKGAVKNAVAKQLGLGATEEAVETGAEALAKSQRGAFGRLWSGAKNTVAPAVGARMSGIDSGLLKAGAKHLDFVEQAEKEGIEDFVNSAHDEIANTFQTATESIGKKIGDTMRGSGATFDTAKVKEPLEKLLSEYKSIAEKAPTKQNLARVGAVEKIIERHFGKEKVVKEVVEDIPADIMGGTFNKFGMGQKSVDRVIPAALPGSVDATTIMALKDDLAEEALFNKGTGPLNAVGRLFGKATGDRRVAGAAAKAYGEINKQIDDQLVGHGELRQQFKELSNLKKMLGSKFSTPEKTFQTLKSLGGKNKRYTLEQLQRMDKTFGGNTVDAAEKLQALAAFGHEPATTAISSKGVTSTIKGGALGFAGKEIAEGVLPEGTPLAGPAGFLLGAAAGSPAAMRGVMKMNQRANNAAAKAFLRPTVKGAQVSLPNVVGQEATEGTWSAIANMNKKEKEKK